MGCAASVDRRSTSVPRAQFTQVVPEEQFAQVVPEDTSHVAPVKLRYTLHNGKLVSMTIGAPVAFKQDDLVTFNSCNFEPDDDDFSAGHALPTCAPNDRRHLRSLEKLSRVVQDFPDRLTNLVRTRRGVF
ncbi:unnamed protein product [Polarella glacialis]|uniref:Uncharacterized protein n=1 Tax=Polarella glacialis TaxID=89957 RepID=A0A813L6P0_POLGL|nr:unnamed protein product [Polarella glacialis]